MPRAKAVPGPVDRWSRVAFRSGELAALCGTPRAANPHPPGSPSAGSWSDGWRKRASPPAPIRKTAARGPTPTESDTDMTLIDKLPAMADDALGVLGANAERLAQTGTAKQQKEAAAVLPAIRAELTTRRERKEAEAPRRATGGRKTAKAKAPKAADHTADQLGDR